MRGKSSDELYVDPMKTIIYSTVPFFALIILLAGCTAPQPLTSGGPQTVYGTPVTGGGTQTTCGCTYAGYVSYAPTNAWGWVPDTNDTAVFTAADGGGRTNVYIYYAGRSSDKNCAQTTVTIPNPPYSTQYRFCIYFPTNVPTTNYPIILTGFE